MSSASRGLAPREDLELELMKLGCIGPPLEPRRRPQAGKSGDPRSQNADSSPRAQGALGLGFEAKPKVKRGAPRAPKACGLGRRVAFFRYKWGGGKSPRRPSLRGSPASSSLLLC